MNEFKQENKLIISNTAFLYVRMLLILLVTLYSSRLIIKGLGVEDYGIYNVIVGFVLMLGFLNSTMTSSLQRYYNYSGTIGGDKEISEVYTIGVYVHWVLAVFVIIILEVLGRWYINNVMVFDASRYSAVKLLFHTSTASLFFALIQTPYIGYIYAKENYGIYALISIIDILLKLFAAITINYIEKDRLVVYGVLLLVTSIIVFFSYLFYAKFKYKELKLNTKISFPLFKSIMSFSSWNMVGTFAFMFKGYGLNLLLNVFFGPIINAARAISFQVNGAITSFSSNVSNAFRSQIVSSYANKDYDRTSSMMLFESKICFMLMSVLMVPAALEINYLLRIWLGNDIPIESSVFSILVLVDSLICTLNTPCTQVAFAVGNIKYYQIYSSIINILLLPASWLLLKYGCSSNSVFIATIVFSALNQILCLHVLKGMFRFSIKSYIKSVIYPCTLFLVSIFVIPFMIRFLLPESIYRLILILLTDVIIGIIIMWFKILSKSQRDAIRSFIRK